MRTPAAPIRRTAQVSQPPDHLLTRPAEPGLPPGRPGTPRRPPPSGPAAEPLQGRQSGRGTLARGPRRRWVGAPANRPGCRMPPRVGGGTPHAGPAPLPIVPQAEGDECQVAPTRRDRRDADGASPGIAGGPGQHRGDLLLAATVAIRGARIGSPVRPTSERNRVADWNRASASRLAAHRLGDRARAWPQSDSATARPATTLRTRAADSPATAGWRRHQRQARSAGRAGRARIGSPARKRRRSSARAAADGVAPARRPSAGTSGRSSPGRAAIRLGTSTRRRQRVLLAGPCSSVSSGEAAWNGGRPVSSS